MKLAKPLRTVLVLAFVAGTLYFQVAKLARDWRESHTELVDSQRVGSDRYDLYYHRETDPYNSIKKNGVVVFDGKDSPKDRGCIQELIVAGGSPFRRCYKSESKEIVLVPLP